MKLGSLHYDGHFGEELYFTFLEFGNRCLIQGCFYSQVYGHRFPYLSIIFGSTRFVSIGFGFLQVGFRIELFGQTCI